MGSELALLKAQVSLQLGRFFSSDNGVSVSIMYSYMYSSIQLRERSSSIS